MIIITQTCKSFSSHYSACRSLYVYATILDWDVENRALITFCIAFVLFEMRCDTIVRGAVIMERHWANYACLAEISFEALLSVTKCIPVILLQYQLFT